MNRLFSRWLQLGAATLLAIPLFGQTPTVTGDTYLQSGTNASLNFGGLANVLVGPGTGATQNHGLIRFDLSGLSGVAANDVQKAIIWVYVNRIITPGAIDVLDVTTSWAESTATWNAPPVSGATQGTIAVTTAGQWVGLDITTLTKVWLATPSMNNGVLLQASSTGLTTAVSLDAKENTATSHPAQLQIVLVGPAGPTGPAGASGPTGPTGPMGPTGPAGAIGPSGPSGAEGPAGPTGPSGAAGAAGPSGPSGAAGAAGPSGPSGAAGAAGPSGPSGPAGSAGAAGPSGPQGAPGVQGNPGATGPSGPSGPAGPGGPAQIFVSGFVSATATPAFHSIGSATTLSTNHGYVQTIMPAACTFNALYVSGTISASAGADTLTVTVFKNGVATALTTAVAVSTLNTPVTSSDTAHSFSVAAGDTVALQVTQTSTTPVVRMNVSTRCQ
jgi:hypothetical protein